jgi:hypothetical protein
MDQTQTLYGNLTVLNDALISYDTQCELTILTKTKGKVSFFPAVNKWVFEKELFHGDAKALVKWIEGEVI